MENLPTILVLVTVSISLYSDIKNNRIPNIITLPAALIALGYHSSTKGYEGLLFGLLGAALGMALLILPYALGGMGAGDVKLMGTVGSFLGTKATFETFIYVALAGGVYSIALMVLQRDAFRGFLREKLMVLSHLVMVRQYVSFRTESLRQKPRLKYAVAIAFGTITYILLKSFGIKLFA